MLRKINKLLSTHDKNFLIGLVFFSIFISLVETMAVSVIMPFISVASNFSLIESNQYFKQVYEFFEMTSAVDFVAWFGLGLFFFYILRSLINIFYFYMLSKFAEGRYYFMSRRLFDTYLHLSNQQFNKLNSAHLTKMIVNEASFFTQVISSLLFMVSEGFVILFIYSILLYVDWKGTLFMTLVLGVVVGLLMRRISRLIKTKGQQREQYQKSVYDILSSSFGNFKVIKLFSNEKEVLNSFLSVSNKFVQTNILFQTSSHIPRLILDALGFASLSFVVGYLVWRNGVDISNFMPILSLYILALYRLLPSVNRILTQYNKITFYSKAIDLVESELGYEQEYLGDEVVTLESNITFRKVSFSYVQDEVILKDINLSIAKNEKIGIIGESGGGKSTLVDMILGLNLPTEGEILVDGQKLSMQNLSSWRREIGYIPQTIYLFEGTVAENITFGREYDEAKIIELLKRVKLSETLLEGEKTEVGEGGKLLSGGQRQRVAIARALYSDPNILVLDEATSALDSRIEQDIMEEIYALCEEKTLIIISHKKKILGGCDRILEIKDKCILEQEKR
jgi:ABC-type multidrug transport system fused ATPase/permease subunit